MLTAYEVAVKVSLLNGVASGLTAMSAQFAKVHGDVNKLQAGLDKIKLTMMTGGLLVGAGAAGFAALEKTVGPASKLTHELVQMNLAGMKSAEIAQSMKAAWAAAYTVPTSSTMETLATIRELRMVFGDTQHAIANAATVQKLQYVLANTAGGNPEMAREEAYTASKALEIRGAVKHPGEFNVQADLIAKAIVASGGKIAASDFKSAFTYGRLATPGWNDEFAYRILPTLIQEFKGKGGTSQGGPGNALMSAYDKIVNGVGKAASFEEAAKLGLINPTKIKYSKEGKIKGIQPGGFYDWELFERNPYEYAQKRLATAYKQRGYTEAQERQSLGIIFASRTASPMMAQLTMRPWQFERDKKLINQAQGIAAYETLIKQDPYAARMMLEKQWQSLLATIGFQIMPAVVGGTLKLVEAVRGLNHWAEQHPTLVKLAVGTLAFVSAIAVAAGSILLIKGAFTALTLTAPLLGGAILKFGGLFAGAIGWIVRGVVTALPILGGFVGAIAEFVLPITLAVGAIGALGYALYQIVKNWDSSKSVVENIKAEAGMFWNWMGEKVKWVLGLIGLKDKPASERQQNQDRRPPGFSEKASPSQNLRFVAPTVTPILPISFTQPQVAAPGASSPVVSVAPPAVSVANYIAPPKPARPIAVSTTINMDGREIARAVTVHQERDLERTSRGSAGSFDTRRSLAPVGLGVA